MYNKNNKTKTVQSSVHHWTYLQLPSLQLIFDVREIIWNDVEQTCRQENTSSKTADETQNCAVGFCK